MEVVKLRSQHGIAKVTGVALCLAGVFVIAFFTGPALSPVNHHRAFHTDHVSSDPTSRATWIKGTFLKLLGDITWSLWIIFQVCYVHGQCVHQHQIISANRYTTMSCKNMRNYHVVCI